jgi:hypothetical protein
LPPPPHPHPLPSPPSAFIWPVTRTGSCVYSLSLVCNLVRSKTTTLLFSSKRCLVYALILPLFCVPLIFDNVGQVILEECHILGHHQPVSLAPVQSTRGRHLFKRLLSTWRTQMPNWTLERGAFRTTENCDCDKD